MYITAQDIRTTRLRGQYRDARFPLPTDPLERAAAAPAAAASIAKAASRLGACRAGMAGQFTPAQWTIPPYRNAGMSGTFDDAKAWAMAPNSFLPSLTNLMVYGGAIGAYLLFFKKGRR